MNVFQAFCASSGVWKKDVSYEESTHWVLKV